MSIREIRQGRVVALGRDQTSRSFPYTVAIEAKPYDLADPNSVPRHWEFRGFDNNENADDEERAGFRSTFIEVGAKVVISTEMFAEQPEFREKGLPEAFIAEMAHLSGRVVKSSSNRETQHLLRSEYRTPDAEKPWRRLVAAERATYDREEDRYTYVQTSHPAPSMDTSLPISAAQVYGQSLGSARMASAADAMSVRVRGPDPWWRRLFQRCFPPKDHGSLRELSRLLGFLDSRLPGLALPQQDGDVAHAAMALLRAAMVQAAAVLTLTRTKVAEAAEVNVRSLFEAWVNLRYLLLHGDRTRNARKYIASASLELRDYLLKVPDSGEDVAKVNALLEKQRQSDAAAVQEVEVQRQGKKYHWSGLLLTKVVDAVGAALPATEVTLLQAYKVMSWSGHHEITVIRDVQRTTLENGEHFEFKYWEPQQEAAEASAHMALGVLADCWTVVAKAFDLPMTSA